ncbi:MAG TPA: sirohydrochlorin cobaltochelatase [Candidatus Sumerlaeota bacterium]|nr:sirohydrochlorin cobaltochelatase [Candidatus Sumerlaeota bacterium]
MKRLMLAGFILLAAMGLWACRGKGKGMSISSETSPTKPAIVLVAFGTSKMEARAVYDHIFEQARKRFPGYEIRWAWTSRIILKKLQAQGLAVYSPDETLEQLRKDGYRQVVMQSFHVMPGAEYEEMVTAGKGASGLSIQYGAPLLADAADIQKAIRAVEPSLRQDRVNVFVGHGNPDKQANAKLVEFTEAVEKGRSNAFVFAVEGEPFLNRLPEVRVKARELGGVHFVPMMVVAGEHIMEDVMGEGAESWRSQIGVADATCAQPLGANDAILDIYFDHTEAALKVFEK